MTTSTFGAKLSVHDKESPDFNLLSDQEYSEEEVAKTMAETMEQYMSKTRADYGSGVARPKIEDKDNFELKGQFLKELHSHSSIMEFDVPTRQFPLDSRGAIPYKKTAADAKIAIQEMAEYSQKWHNGTSRVRSIEQSKGPPLTSKDCPLKEEGKTLEESYYTQLGRPFQGGGYRAIALGNQEASIKTLEIQIGQMSKVLQERGFGSYKLNKYKPARPIPHVDLLQLIEAEFILDNAKKRTMDQNLWKLMELHISMTPYPKREKDQGVSLYLLYNNVCFDNALIDLGASVNVMPLLTYLNLGLSKLAHTKLTVELADRTMKYTKGIAENILKIGKSYRIDDEVVQNQRQRDDNDLQDERQYQPKEEEVEPRRSKRARTEKSFGPILFLLW
ncbi:hypothetical protein Tco_1354690 [Tanacetum coccineum]